MKEFKRNETDIKVVSTKLIYYVMISVFLMFICLITGIVLLCFKKFVSSYIFFGIALVFFIFGKICDNLEWYKNVVYKFFDSKLVYSYDLDEQFIARRSSTVTVTISGIKSITVHGDKITVKGNIVKKHPVSGAKSLKKVRLLDVPEHHDEIMDLLRGLSARSLD